ncbi:MAG: hypothetical protein FJY37_07190 [Betaproteobacteria bacterium]|nr:hypothetical protein [Betaproteobacteria bacterium]
MSGAIPPCADQHETARPKGAATFGKVELMHDTKVFSADTDTVEAGVMLGTRAAVLRAAPQ